LDHNSKESDAPIAIAQLTWPNLFDYQLSTYYSWEYDLQALGGSIQRAIDQNLGLIAQAELVQHHNLPGNICYFCDLTYSFGPTSTTSKKSTTDANGSSTSSDWLNPIPGANIEHVKTVRNVGTIKIRIVPD